MDNAFARPTDQVLSTLGVQASTGLTDAQVKDIRKKHGKNGKPDDDPSIQPAQRLYTDLPPQKQSQRSLPLLCGS